MLYVLNFISKIYKKISNLGISNEGNLDVTLPTIYDPIANRVNILIPDFLQNSDFDETGLTDERVPRNPSECRLYVQHLYPNDEDRFREQEAQLDLRTFGRGGKRNQYVRSGELDWDYDWNFVKEVNTLELVSLQLDGPSLVSFVLFWQ